MKAYKLTDHNKQTKNDTQWGENVTHSATGTSDNLCTDGWIHFYMDPLIAVMMVGAHVSFQYPILWECNTEGEHLHEPLKSGCKTLTTIRQISLPEVTINQRIAFAILCAKKLCVYETCMLTDDVKWNEWADKWLSGEDRSYKSAKAINGGGPNYESDMANAIWCATKSDFPTRSVARYTGWVAICAAGVVTHDDKTIDFIAIAQKALTY